MKITEKKQIIYFNLKYQNQNPDIIKYLDDIKKENEEIK